MTKNLRDEKQSGEVKTKISNLAHSYVNSHKPTLHALKEHQTLFYIQIKVLGQLS